MTISNADSEVWKKHKKWR